MLKQAAANMRKLLIRGANLSKTEKPCGGSESADVTVQTRVDAMSDAEILLRMCSNLEIGEKGQIRFGPRVFLAITSLLAKRTRQEVQWVANRERDVGIQEVTRLRTELAQEMAEIQYLMAYA